ncbi:hypothetical protein BD779DRAFT_1471263 [Infundibulicybe gibba]|nr:hypothetical protein BD779DRAFT_1471263 [Infundibulicybe gibba]
MSALLTVKPPPGYASSRLDLLELLPLGVCRTGGYPGVLVALILRVLAQEESILCLVLLVSDPHGSTAGIFPRPVPVPVGTRTRVRVQVTHGFAQKPAIPAGFAFIPRVCIKQGQIVIIAPAELPVALPVTRKTGTGFCGFAKSVPTGNPYLYPWENPYGLHYPC